MLELVASPPQMVPELMNDLFSWMKKNCKNIHPLIMSAVFHYEFVLIHPFADGNGRMARLWHTAGNANVFIEFMLCLIDKILDDVIVQIAKSNADTSEYVKT
jgi:fido (protein-threonine AMPylation protein)